MASTTTVAKRRRKPALKVVTPKKQAPTATPGYDDEVTRETINKLNKVVGDDEFLDHETHSGPAW
jgi:hypothetical protein